jgi:integrase
MGEERTDWLWPEQAFALIEAAKANDLEFGIFIVTLLYTGMRLECDRLRASESYAQLPKTKNGEGRGIHLPPVVVPALADHPRGLNRPGERVFRFRKNSRLCKRLNRVVHAAKCNTLMAHGKAFHILCHTYATWMRRYSKLDIQGLVATGRWKSATAARRYAHVVASEEAQCADALPTPTGGSNLIRPALKVVRA